MRHFPILFFLFGAAYLSAQTVDTFVYKRVGDLELRVEVFAPVASSPDSLLPATIFYFGGGWVGGDRNHFRPQASYLAERGMYTVLADYRTRNANGTTPFESLMDAKSAMRWLKREGTSLGIDTSKIVAGGGSAGGHLAAATALIANYNDPEDDLRYSSVPAALLLFNPVIDNGPAGYGYERIGEAYPHFSPLHNVRAGAPPTLFLLGTEDRLIPVATAEYYKTAMERVGSKCFLRLYAGGKHGFFNPPNTYLYRQTILEMDEFLVGLGYLPPIGREGY